MVAVIALPAVTAVHADGGQLSTEVTRPLRSRAGAIDAYTGICIVLRAAA